MVSELRYPEREHYEFPRSSIEQAEEELRIYSKPSEFRRNLVYLNKRYSGTPCMQAMRRYAEFASVLQHRTRSRLNFDFYSGTLVAVHAHTAPYSSSRRALILGKNFLRGFEENPNRELIEMNIMNFLDTWSGKGKDNWNGFLAGHSEAYQNAVIKLAEKTFEGKKEAFERELDFVIGFTFAANLVEQLVENEHYQFAPPV